MTTMMMMEEEEKDNSIPEFCFLNVSIAGAMLPTNEDTSIVIQLYRRKECPTACRNFVALCSSTETTSRRTPCPSYRGCDFHRIIDGFMVQSGDFERFDGTGGYMSPSLLTHDNNNNGNHHRKMFDDETMTGTHHDQAGIVSMANSGKNTNKSQFFITLKATPHLDGKHVAFGKVVSGMPTVMKMLSVELDGRDRPVPMQRVVIYDCGVGRGGDEKHTNDESAEERHNRKKKKKKSKKRKKRSRESRRPRSSDEESSSSSDSSSSHDGDDRRPKKRKRRYHRDSSSDDESSHDQKKKRKKNSNHRRKEHRHKKKSSRQRRQSPR
jgi:cyclophilin family peptidyl-prolyl cis-trans isomerase